MARAGQYMAGWKPRFESKVGLQDGSVEEAPEQLDNGEDVAALKIEPAYLAEEFAFYCTIVVVVCVVTETFNDSAATRLAPKAALSLQPDNNKNIAAINAEPVHEALEAFVGEDFALELCMFHEAPAPTSKYCSHCGADMAPGGRHNYNYDA